MKRLVAIMLAAVLLAGCSWREPDYVPSDDLLNNTDPTEKPNQPATAQDFSLAYYPDRSLNPYQCTDYTNRVLFSLLYQGLFAVDRNYEPKPILCKNYNMSSDMRSWTFYVADAVFSDGSAVTAEDVRASLQAAVGSAWFGRRLMHVKSISALGDAVVLQLATPMENLPVLLDIPIVKASQVNAAQPLGTGPYRMDGNQLKRQGGWWCEAALPVSAQTISLTPAQSTVHIRDSFETEDVGIVCADPGGEDYAQFRRDHELWDSENGLFMYLAANSKSAVFSNPAMCAALTYAIDRDYLTDTYFYGLAHSATLPASPQSPYYNDKLAAKFGFDLERFKQTVIEQGMSGKPITLMVCAADQVRTKCAHYIGYTLLQCGLPVTVKTVSAARLATELKAGNYDLFLGQTRLSANMDLSAFFAPKGVLNYGGLADPACYAMCLESLANANNYYSLHKMVMENSRLCPVLFQSYAVYGVRGVTDGLLPARDHIFYYDLGLSMQDIKITE